MSLVTWIKVGETMEQLKVNSMTRRRALERIGGGFGLVGLSAMTGQSLANAATTSAAAADPLSVKAPHYPAKAKNVIFLFLNGGVSHMDTFDPKPMLDKYHGKPLPGGNPATSNTTATSCARLHVQEVRAEWPRRK